MNSRRHRAPSAPGEAPPAPGDTIAALATAAGPAGIAVVRISGSGAWAVAARVVAPRSGGEAFAGNAGRCRHVRLHDPLTAEVLDDGVMLVFRAPRSYTGEDVVELQGHGGGVAARRLLEAVLAAGARLAEPGEFTRRAFLNGRLDLTQAEAVLDLIQARTDRAAQAARARLDGRLGADIHRLYDSLTAICADIEALLDFSEDDVPEGFMEETARRLGLLLEAVRARVATWHAGHLLREGALVVISGRPNAGKSSLLNALLGCDRAIVSEIPGTTRDAIEESISLDGIPVRLVDTAGLRKTDCAIEAEGVARAGTLVARADLNLHLLDGSRPLDAEDHRHLEALSPARTLLVLGKADLPPRIAPAALPSWACVPVSARTGKGLEDLRRTLGERLGVDQAAPMGSEISTRHRRELEQAADAIAASVDLLAGPPDGLVLAALRLREAALALGRITGRVWSEELLDAVFSRFCVGK
ncbi:MAG: tRNA uridine-5-carboxymethylaminomethyl(34) synthesis GTPase MnmE [Lentisphaerae bacterium]|nr:tRNA uridine-5-carboxymethylaminomethyl(34) synthesis GTPase MnmE [Lentisphaerota bacterium]